jgi:hypothetical protein
MPQQKKSYKQDKIYDLDPHVKKLVKGDGVRSMGNYNGCYHKTTDHNQHVRKFKGDH